jgi:spore cortex formation protein SpoVR/YcgB (stage V sporulation)
LDRINLVQVPYCLRYSEEVKIYQKLINGSKLSNAPVAPGTFEMLAKFTVLSRLHETKLNPNLYTKMEVYNGENLKNTDAKAKSLLEYKSDAGITEGMEGVSTRFAYKILSKVYNANPEDISANPIDLMNILVTEIEKEKERYLKEKEDKDFVTGTLRQKYFEFLEKQLRTAILSSSDDYCQNLYERYILMANDWIEDQDFREPQAGLQLNVDELNQALTAIAQSGISYGQFGVWNPYSLGYAIFTDIERICTKPTEEDKYFFPELIGQNPIDATSEAMKNFNDSGFISQYLSPKVIRDFKMFTLFDESKQAQNYVVSSVSDENGYNDIKNALATQYERNYSIPNIEVVGANLFDDRKLVLKYNSYRDRKLNEATKQKMLKHLRNLWGYDVVIE